MERIEYVIGAMLIGVGLMLLSLQFRGPVVSTGVQMATPTVSMAVADQDTATDPILLLQSVYRRGKAGEWWAVFALALSLLVWGFRWMFRNSKGFKKWIVSSRAGSVAFTALLAGFGMLLTRMAAGGEGPPSLSALWAAVNHAILAIGSWHALIKPLANWVKKLVK